MSDHEEFLEAKIEELEDIIAGMYTDDELEEAKEEAYETGWEEALSGYSELDMANRHYAEDSAYEWLRDSVLPNLKHLDLESLIDLAKDVTTLIEEVSE